jgi:hypothetical protein
MKKFRATVSTAHSTGQVESEEKQELLDFISAWMFELEMDPVKTRLEDCPGENEGEIVVLWTKGKNSITCNFEV